MLLDGIRTEINPWQLRKYHRTKVKKRLWGWYILSIDNCATISGKVRNVCERAAHNRIAHVLWNEFYSTRSIVLEPIMGHPVKYRTGLRAYINDKVISVDQQQSLSVHFKSIKLIAKCPLTHSRRKVQKLRDQSQYISKKVRALQYWRWACGTCCKQYHMLFYIQMAVVSTAIFFLFSPSFSFFLEIKVQIYIYFQNKCQYINQFPPKP